MERYSKRTVFRIESIMDETADRASKSLKRGDKRKAAAYKHNLSGMKKLARGLGVHCSCPSVAGRERCRCGDTLNEMNQRVKAVKAGW